MADVMMEATKAKPRDDELTESKIFRSTPLGVDLVFAGQSTP
jgi:hypothetical protein